MDTAKALSAPLMPQTELEQSELKIKLANAGFRSDSAVAIYLGLRFVSLIGFFLLAAMASSAEIWSNRDGPQADCYCNRHRLLFADCHSVVDPHQAASRRSSCRCPTPWTCWSCASKAAWVWTRPCGKCATK